MPSGLDWQHLEKSRTILDAWVVFSPWQLKFNQKKMKSVNLEEKRNGNGMRLHSGFNLLFACVVALLLTWVVFLLLVLSNESWCCQMLSRAEKGRSKEPRHCLPCKTLQTLNSLSQKFNTQPTDMLNAVMQPQEVQVVPGYSEQIIPSENCWLKWISN